MKRLLISGTQSIDLQTLAPDSTQLIVEIAAHAQITIIDSRVIDNKEIEFVIHAHARTTITLSPSTLRVQKTQITLQLVGTGAHATLTGKEKIIGTQKHHLFTKQLHKAAHTYSACIVRTAQYDQTHTSYEGIITIEKSAEASQAFQDHKALLLSDQARAYARPSLEAKTDEVQCGHGSAISYCDPEQLWYLQSRGIPLKKAQSLLVTAFLQY